jgi:hypothetical protein
MDGDGWDHLLKVVNTLFREHPFHTVRAGELERWRSSGAYEAIVGGVYPRRGEPDAGADFSDAARYYSARVDEVVSSARAAFDRAVDAFRDAFRRA